MTGLPRARAAAANERARRAQRAAAQVKAGQLAHDAADADDALWKMIEQWAASPAARMIAADFAIMAPPAARVAAAAMKAHLANEQDRAAATRAAGLTDLARILAIKAQTWAGGREYVDAYLDAMAAAARLSPSPSAPPTLSEVEGRSPANRSAPAADLFGTAV